MTLLITSLALVLFAGTGLLILARGQDPAAYRRMAALLTAYALSLAAIAALYTLDLP